MIISERLLLNLFSAFLLERRRQHRHGNRPSGPDKPQVRPLSQGLRPVCVCVCVCIPLLEAGVASGVFLSRPDAPKPSFLSFPAGRGKKSSISGGANSSHTAVFHTLNILFENSRADTFRSLRPLKRRAVRTSASFRRLSNQPLVPSMERTCACSSSRRS